MKTPRENLALRIERALNKGGRAKVLIKSSVIKLMRTVTDSEPLLDMKPRAFQEWVTDRTGLRPAKAYVAKEYVKIPPVSRTKMETINWVAGALEPFTHLGEKGWPKDLAGLNPPSWEAVRLLKRVIEDSKTEDAFWAGNWGKLIPTQKAIEAEESRHDDGAELFRLIDQLDGLKREVVKPSSDQSVYQPPVQAFAM